ncbi:MAG: rRNA pseudouridine synthase [Nitrososphaera sp.]|nr:rRNA pseudouridine synthase [Nitrososphaera sp.]MCI0706810.1 rRNA pseudouridine synthase [Ignavibacteriota bacterium]
MATTQRDSARVPEESIRLNKYLALAGIGSRRSNDELILSGAVKINGRVIQEFGVKVNPRRDRVTVQGNPVFIEHKQVYFVLNKPKDTITTVKDEKGRPTVMDYVRSRERVYPIGRLDRNTTGVLLFTNDGELANALMHPKFEVEKVYHVKLDKGISDDDFRRLETGIRLEDGMAQANFAEVLPKTKRMELFVSIHEGRNREVRRMFEAMKYDVKRLDRISFAGITTTGLPRGKWRKLQSKEVEHLKKVAGLAS